MVTVGKIEKLKASRQDSDQCCLPERIQIKKYVKLCITIIIGLLKPERNGSLLIFIGFLKAKTLYLFMQDLPSVIKGKIPPSEGTFL